MSWNPNQGQDPNQPSQYGGYSGYNPPPPQPTDPYSGPQGGYQQGGQQGGYQQGAPYSGQQQYGQGGYQQPYGGPGASQYGPSTMQMDPKTAAGLSYILGWITGIIFFLMEKQNRFVRFHALQAILLGVSATVLYIVLVILGVASAFIDQSGALTGLIFGLGSLVVWGAAVVGWLIGMINAFQGKYFKLPLIGDYADRWSNLKTASAY